VALLITMRISVVLCTWNGARHLPAQLESIATQERLPDELVACDDASTDGSPQLLRDLAGRVPFPVRCEANATNLKSTKNFEQAITLCTGDVIALADQDDVWRADKLARLERALLDRPEAGLVFSDALVVDESLRPLGYTLWQAIEFPPAEQRRFRDGDAFALLLRRYRVTGATLAFRAAYKDLVLPIPGAWVHDAWIALLIAAVAPVALVAEPLLQYRQHPTQQLGQRKRSLYQQYLAARSMSRDTYQAVADRFGEARERLLPVPGLPAERIEALTQKIDHYRQRARMRERGVWRLPIILREAWRGHYCRYSLGWKAIAQDLFLP
jgi:glycosyltransferase involved in cell wall biosynthesis